MQKIFAALAFLMMAACGSASQTGSKTAGPPVISAKKAKRIEIGDQKPPVEAVGQTVTVNVFGIKMTLTSSPWKGKLHKKQDGSPLLVFARPDVPGALVVDMVDGKSLTAQGVAEDQRKQAIAEGATVSALAAEAKGRYAFTFDAVDDGQQVKSYFSIMPHPTIADHFLILMASCMCERKDADALFDEVRAIADSLSPIR